MRQNPSRFTVGLIQMSCSPRVDENLEKAVNHIKEAAHRGAQVVCLQELFRSQYFCQNEDVALFDLAEPIPGPTIHMLANVANTERIVVIASLFERRDAGVYHNTSAVIDSDGTLMGIYRK